MGQFFLKKQKVLQGDYKMTPNQRYFLEQAESANYSSGEVVRKFSKLFKLSERKSIRIVESYAIEKLPHAKKRKCAILIFETVLSLFFMCILFIAPVKNPEWSFMLAIIVLFGSIPIISLIRHIYER